MVDWIISKVEKTLERPNDRLVEKELIYFEGSTKLFVLIDPYRSNLGLFSGIKKFIKSRGESSIAYRFPADILTSDYKSTYDGFKKMRADISLDLEDLKKEYGFKEIEVLGFSLSCVPALMIANGNPLINSIKLVVPGHCLAESLWFGIRTDDLRKGFEKKGVTLEKLKEYWKDLAPENNIDKLSGKKISIFLSEADTVIPYKFGMNLVKSLEQHNVPFELKTNKHLGHYLTVYNLLRHPSKFI